MKLERACRVVEEHLRKIAKGCVVRVDSDHVAVYEKDSKMEAFSSTLYESLSIALEHWGGKK